jgi:tetratricopeptide (TPR) repeat protein
MISFQLQPLQMRHIRPFLDEADSENIYAAQLFQAVTHFYSGAFDEAAAVFQQLRGADPHDIRAAFFDALIPFLHSYFFEEESGTNTIAFQEKVARFPVLRAKSGDTLSRLLVSGVFGYASLHAIKRNKPFDAGTYGLEGWAYLKKVTTEDTTGFSLIGRGLMSFLAGSAPFPVRLTLSAQGIEANREKGILMLERAAQSDTIVSADAALILSQLYPLIQEPGKARHYAEELCRVYPENRVYQKVRQALLQ